MTMINSGLKGLNKHLGSLSRFARLRLTCLFDIVSLDLGDVNRGLL